MLRSWKALDPAVISVRKVAELEVAGSLGMSTLTDGEQPDEATADEALVKKVKKGRGKKKRRLNASSSSK